MVDHVSHTNYVKQQFGNYRLLRPLNIGKDNTLYLGEHLHLKTLAAIKLYHSQLLQDDQASFLAEAHLLARLIHPHIARVIEGGVEHDIPFLVMAYTSAGTLRLRHPGGVPLPLSVIVTYVKQLAAALDYIHSQQVLHLDIKPENIWIGYNDETLLSNFRVTLPSHSSRSESVQDVIEVVNYMAPEQIQGHASPASDQYMVGIVVYEWLCGSRPFLSANYVEIARHHLHTPPPALCGKVPDLAPAVEQVVMRALSKDEAERFPTMQAFAYALEQSYLAPWNIATPPPFFIEHSQVSLSTFVNKRPAPATAKNRSMRRRITFGLVGFAAAIAGSVIWFSRPMPPPKIKPLPAKHVPAGTTLYTYRGHVDIAYGVAWSLDGKNIASWGRDNTMQIWNASTFSHIRTYPMGDILAWSPDWQFVASGDAHNLQVWEIATGRTMIYYDVPNTGAGIIDLPINSSVRWSPNGKYLASALDAIHVWDITTGKTLFSSLSGSVAWSSDGKHIALCTQDFSVASPLPPKLQILDVATENRLASYTMGSNTTAFLPLQWSPNGKFLLSGNDVLDATTGKHITTYKGQPLTMVWSPNSQYLAAFDNSEDMSQRISQQLLPAGTMIDTTVHIWNALTGEDVFVYRGHTAGVNYVAWSQDGTRIASASADTTVKLWQAI